MKTLILSFFTALVSLTAAATTIDDRVAELEAVPGIGQGNVRAHTALAKEAPFFSAWSIVDVTHIYVSADEVQQNTISLLVRDIGTGTEDAYYFPRRPSALNNLAPKYLSGVTHASWTGLNDAQKYQEIVDKANAKWLAANAGSEPIREFGVSIIDPTTLLVYGSFDVGTTWQTKQWYIHVVDGTAAPTGANLKFEEKTG